MRYNRSAPPPNRRTKSAPARGSETSGTGGTGPHGRRSSESDERNGRAARPRTSARSGAAPALPRPFVSRVRRSGRGSGRGPRAATRRPPGSRRIASRCGELRARARWRTRLGGQPRPKAAETFAGWRAAAQGQSAEPSRGGQRHAVGPGRAAGNRGVHAPPRREAPARTPPSQGQLPPPRRPRPLAQPGLTVLGRGTRVCPGLRQRRMTRMFPALLPPLCLRSGVSLPPLSSSLPLPPLPRCGAH